VGWLLLGAWGISGAIAQTQVRAATEKGVPAVLLSDIHFDPFRDPAKVPKLVAAPVTEWEAILKEPFSADQAKSYEETLAACGGGKDSDEALLNATLVEAKTHIKDAGFVTVSGDLLVHQFDCRYRFATKGSTQENAAEFADETAAYVMQRVEAAFPGLPVYFALGNNDSDCGDYKLSPHDGFLEATSEALARGLRLTNEAEIARVVEDYEAGGYYSVALGGVAKTRLIVIDDIFEAATFEPCWTSTEETPKSDAERPLKWLKGELDQARERGEKVWVMGHIPPGPDAYNTLKHFTSICSRAPAMFLGSSELADELVAHADAVQLALFAHTHMDEMRLLERPGSKGAVAMKLVPSISPVHGNLPGFMVAKVDGENGVLLDYEVYTTADTAGAVRKWKREYGFGETYHQPDYSAASVRKLMGELQADKSAERPATKAYENYFSAGGGGSPLFLVWPQYACGLTRDRADDFKNCLCGVK
jgi:sphingomyelin phosphodiesterase acid-like 3